MENYNVDVSVLAEQFLGYLDTCGSSLGYPFMIFANGECGKGLVSSDGKHNAVAKVLKPSKDKGSLSSFASAVKDITDGLPSGDKFLKYLNEQGKALGFPFVLLADGRVIKNPLSEADKTMSVVKVLRSFKDDAKIVGIKASLPEKHEDDAVDSGNDFSELKAIINDDAKIGSVKTSLPEKHEDDAVDSGNDFSELKAIINDDDWVRFEKLQIFNHQMVEYVLKYASKKLLNSFLSRCEPSALSIRERNLLLLKKDNELIQCCLFTHSRKKIVICQN